MSDNYGYVWKNLIAIDQLLNTILAGYPAETLSSRSYRSAVLEPYKKKRWVIAHNVINFLFRWQSKEHCKEAYLAELNLKHNNPNMIKWKDVYNGN